QDDNDTLKSKLEIFVSGYKMNPKIAKKYSVSVRLVNEGKPRAYRLVGVPNAGTGYTLSVWMNSVGDGYKCRDATSAQVYLETLSANTGCEAFSNRKK
ncbi:TPA: PilX family type IV pilin, partial [Neisseria gonorrhoeae]